jgi:hypothetical protein
MDYTNVAMTNQSNSFAAGQVIDSTLNVTGGSGITGLYVDSSGRVGIGTTSPNNKLFVSFDEGGKTTPALVLQNTHSTTYGSLGLYPQQDGAGGWISFGANVTSNSEIPSTITSQHSDRYPGLFGYDASTTSATSRFYFLGSPAGTSQTATELMSILNTGNVGIGTTNPQSLLDVNGTANFTGGIDTSGLTINGTQGLTDSTSYWLCTAADCSTKCQVTITNGLITACT